MTDLYIATPTQADYDALMRLAEAAGYTKIFNESLWEGEEAETVIRLDVSHKIILHYSVGTCEANNWTIETIPNLADIKVIWKVSRENRDAFTMKHRLPPHYKSARKLYVICDEYSGTYTTKENEIYDALAVEYKPKESEEVMSKTVKLPKFLCDQISTLKGSLSIEKISGPKEAVEFMNRLKKMYGKANVWLRDSRENQWKLIGALRNGYEPEPEQLYYVPLIKNNEDGYLNRDSTGGHMYLDDNTNYSSTKTKFTMPEIIAIDPRYKAFAVPVGEVDE